jgi:hypothetical protein
MQSVLVRGGMHGSWCFHPLIPESARLGHNAVSIDLPGQGALRTGRLP